MAQSRMSSRKQALRELLPSLKPRLYLILFLVFAFFLICPLWAYLSFCGPGACSGVVQDRFLYNIVFNMPMSLPMSAVLLVILVSSLLIAIYPQSPVFRIPIDRILARAPPLG
jgi:hypothetical protein